MRVKHTMLAIAAIATAFTGAAFAQSAGNATPDNGQPESWLTIPVIYENVTAAGYTDISEIERDDGKYEVKGVDADGNRVKLYVDPQSGEILDVRTKGSKKKADKKSGS